MKKFAIVLLALVLALSMLGCGCKHEWLAATCDAPKTCELCGETEGEAKGHSMVEASCEEAAHCENCDLTEGEALDHVWLPATTEAPITCENCGETDGERIITDERFTTAATIDLQGKWVIDVALTGDMMGIPDFTGTAGMKLFLDFGEAGDLGITVEIDDSFTEGLIQYTVDLMYAELAAQGLDQASADAMFEGVYGSTIQAYVEEEIAATDFDAMFASIFEAAGLNGVYYVEDGLLYTGESWEDNLVGESYTLDRDSLVIESFTEELGIEKAFVRVAE